MFVWFFLLQFFFVSCLCFAADDLILNSFQYTFLKYTQPTPGISVCVPCATGTFSSSFGLSSCTRCAGGYYASIIGSSNCTVCSGSGSYSAAGASVCSQCSAGSIPANGRSSCSQCAGALVVLAHSSVVGPESHFFPMLLKHIPLSYTLMYIFIFTVFVSAFSRVVRRIWIVDLYFLSFWILCNVGIIELHSLSCQYLLGRHRRHFFVVVCGLHCTHLQSQWLFSML